MKKINRTGVGGKITDLRGEPFNVYQPECLATKGFDHAVALKLVSDAVQSQEGR